jgi:hypothetical protein
MTTNRTEGMDAERLRTHIMDVVADVTDQSYDIAFVYAQTGNSAKVALDGPPHLMASILRDVAVQLDQADPMPDRVREIGIYLPSAKGAKPERDKNLGLSILQHQIKHFEDTMSKPAWQTVPEDKKAIGLSLMKDLTDAIAWIENGLSQQNNVTR